MEVTLCQGHRETNFTLAHSPAPGILTLSGDSAAGNRTRVFRVTGGNTNHYTTTDMVLGQRQVLFVDDCLQSDSRRFITLEVTHCQRNRETNFALVHFGAR